MDVNSWRLITTFYTLKLTWRLHIGRDHDFKCFCEKGIKVNQRNIPAAMSTAMRNLFPSFYLPLMGRQLIRVSTYANFHYVWSTTVNLSMHVYLSVNLPRVVNLRQRPLRYLCQRRYRYHLAGNPYSWKFL